MNEIKSNENTQEIESLLRKSISFLTVPEDNYPWRENLWPGYTLNSIENFGRRVQRNPKIASMPLLLAAKATADLESPIWDDKFYSTLTEQFVVEGAYSRPQIITLHGGGLITPLSVNRAYDAREGKLTSKGV